jgi:uncharacterized protein
MSVSLLALLDDITTVLDDVALLTKVAAKKTAGVLGDDLALNAQQVHGVAADRELPVVWAVCKGSALNKVILVPLALAISAFAPWAVTPLLMVGGLFLCFEGFEKLAHKFFHSADAEAAAEDGQHQAALVQALSDPAVDLVAFEKDKIKGAVRTDFVLSAEIIAITLGTVAAQPLLTQFTVLAGISVLMTVGVYGAVAGIVKLDDLGLFLSRSVGANLWARFKRRVGAAVLSAAPYLMRGLTIAGTAAMFLVGGGILTHGWPWLHHALEKLAQQAAALPSFGAVLAWLTPLLGDALAGLLAGALAWLVMTAVKRFQGAATAS